MERLARLDDAVLGARGEPRSPVTDTERVLTALLFLGLALGAALNASSNDLFGVLAVLCLAHALYGAFRGYPDWLSRNPAILGRPRERRRRRTNS